MVGTVVIPSVGLVAADLLMAGLLMLALLVAGDDAISVTETFFFFLKMQNCYNIRILSFATLQ